MSVQVLARTAAGAVGRLRLVAGPVGVEGAPRPGWRRGAGGSVHALETKHESVGEEYEAFKPRELENAVGSLTPECAERAEGLRREFGPVEWQRRTRAFQFLVFTAGRGGVEDAAGLIRAYAGGASKSLAGRVQVARSHRVRGAFDAKGRSLTKAERKVIANARTSLMRQARSLRALLGWGGWDEGPVRDDAEVIAAWILHERRTNARWLRRRNGETGLARAVRVAPSLADDERVTRAVELVFCETPVLQAVRLLDRLAASRSSQARVMHGLEGWAEGEVIVERDQAGAAMLSPTGISKQRVVAVATPGGAQMCLDAAPVRGDWLYPGLLAALAARMSVCCFGRVLIPGTRIVGAELTCSSPICPVCAPVRAARRARARVCEELKGWAHSGRCAFLTLTVPHLAGHALPQGARVVLTAEEWSNPPDQQDGSAGWWSYTREQVQLVADPAEAGAVLVAAGGLSLKGSRDSLWESVRELRGAPRSRQRKTYDALVDGLFLVAEVTGRVWNADAGGWVLRWHAHLHGIVVFRELARGGRCSADDPGPACEQLVRLWSEAVFRGTGRHARPEAQHVRPLLRHKGIEEELQELIKYPYKLDLTAAQRIEVVLAQRGVRSRENYGCLRRGTKASKHIDEGANTLELDAVNDGSPGHRVPTLEARIRATSATQTWLDHSGLPPEYALVARARGADAWRQEARRLWLVRAPPCDTSEGPRGFRLVQGRFVPELGSSEYFYRHAPDGWPLVLARPSNLGTGPLVLIEYDALQGVIAGEREESSSAILREARLLSFENPRVALGRESVVVGEQAARFDCRSGVVDRVQTLQRLKREYALTLRTATTRARTAARKATLMDRGRGTPVPVSRGSWKPPREGLNRSLAREGIGQPTSFGTDLSKLQPGDLPGDAESHSSLSVSHLLPERAPLLMRRRPRARRGSRHVNERGQGLPERVGKGCEDSQTGALTTVLDAREGPRLDPRALREPLLGPALGGAEVADACADCGEEGRVMLARHLGRVRVGPPGKP